MSTLIFEAGSRVGKANVTVTNITSDRQEIFKGVQSITLVGQTLVIHKVEGPDLSYTATYPESSVMLDITSEKVGE